MKMVIRLLIFFSVICFSERSFSCKLNTENEYISLSGPITMLLEQMGLLKDPKLLAISTLHPVKNESGPTRIAGGLFLSSKTLKSFTNKVVFIDASKELESNIQKYPIKKLIIISTRSQNAMDVVASNIESLKPFLTGCEDKVSEVATIILKIKERLKNVNLSNKIFLFYLGKITVDQFPNMLMVRDGFVQDLLSSNLKSYPSELAYVNWSEKIVKSLGANVWHIGLDEGLSDKLEVEKIDGHKYNFRMRGLLTPGISQVILLDKILNENFFR